MGIGVTAKPIPYPADTRAKGWRFEIDYEKVEQSDTWSLAAEVPMAQHSLLMMWVMAWTQVPCGSMPSDPAIIRAKCKVPPKMWTALQPVLLRGWWLAEDGRLYHDTIVSRVLEMLEYRAANAKRVADSKARKRESRGGNALPTGDSPGNNDTGTGTNSSEAKASGGEPPTDRDLLFSNGVPLLTAAGVSEKNARSMLAGLAKSHGDAAVVQALNDCAASRPVEPVSWLQAALRTTPAGRPTFAQQAADIARITVPSKPGKDAALAQLDADAAITKPPTPEQRQQIQQAIQRMRA